MKPTIAAAAGLIAAMLLPSKTMADKSSLTPLEDRVRHELVTLPFYTVFDNLTFQVDGDEVTLSGQVTRPTLKSDAEHVVAHIEGIAKVRNEIEVLPLSSFDDRIRLAVYLAIYGDDRVFGGFSRWPMDISSPMLQYAIQPVAPIRIIVKNGNLTLHGLVATEIDKNVIYMRANSVGGVFSVTNKLIVRHD
jgi:hyperosmotically inducible periplasmic protein